MDYTIPSLPDTAGLQELWQRVFGDSPELIQSWFSAFYRPELTAAFTCGGRTAAMAYVLPAGTLQGMPCAHIYAVGVDPAFRGQGLGAAITRLAVQRALDSGFTAVILHPAEEGLFHFYRRCGFETLCSVTEQAITLPAAARPAPCPAVPDFAPAAPAEYLAYRRRLLQGRPAVDQGEDIVAFFESLGGRLYVGENFCAAVESLEGTAYFRELLFTGPLPGRETLAAMAPEAEKAVIRCPGLPVGEIMPFAMIYLHDRLPQGFLTQEPLCWPGFALE